MNTSRRRFLGITAAGGFFLPVSSLKAAAGRRGASTGRRASPLSASAMDFLKSGRAGRIPLVRAIVHHPGAALGDSNVDWMDQILCLADDKRPSRVHSTSTPDSRVATFEFESFTAVWEYRPRACGAARAASGLYFYGSEGTLHMDPAGGWSFHPIGRNKPVLRHAPEPGGFGLENARAL